jgi:hypothetical protein
MRFSAIIFCAAGLVLVGCARHRTTETTSASWLSGPELESRVRPIAEAYAKEHGIAFDFTGTHCEIRIDTGDPSPVCGTVTIYHGYHGLGLQGIGKLEFVMMIDRTGQITQAFTVVPEVGGQTIPGH